MIAALISIVAPMALTLPPVQISEIRYDSTEPLEGVQYIELVSLPETVLDICSLVVMGQYGIINAVVHVDGITDDNGTYLVAGSWNVLEPPQQSVPSLNMATQENITVFLVPGHVNIPTGVDLDTDDDGKIEHVAWEYEIDSVQMKVQFNAPTYSENTVFNDLYVWGIERCMDAPYPQYRTLVREYPSDGDSPGEVNTPCAGVVCPGDLNGDYSVDEEDIGFLFDRWGDFYGPCDLNQDGTVNAQDMSVVLGNWGGCDL